MRKLQKTSPTVLIRVDVGNRVGVGHLVEAETLCHALRQDRGATPCFLLVSDPVWNRRLSARHTPSLFVPGAAESESADIAATRGILERRSPAVLVCDQCERSTAYYNSLCDARWRTLVVLDHHRVQRLAADMVVSFNICQREAAYPRQESGRYFLGPLYMPMSPELAAPRPVKVRRRVQHTLVNSGGSDPFALTPKIIRALAALPLREAVTVVMGPAMLPEHRAAVRAAAAAFPGPITIHENLPHRDMLELMSGCDVAITAPGNTLYELCALGVPALVLSHHRRHRRVAACFAARGAVAELGVGRWLSQAAIADAYAALCQDYERRRTLQRQARQVCDGRGTARLCGLIRDLASRLSTRRKPSDRSAMAPAGAG